MTSESKKNNNIITIIIVIVIICCISSSISSLYTKSKSSIKSETNLSIKQENLSVKNNSEQESAMIKLKNTIKQSQEEINNAKLLQEGEQKNKINISGNLANMPVVVSTSSSQ